MVAVFFRLFFHVKSATFFERWVCYYRQIESAEKYKVFLIIMTTILLEYDTKHQ